MSEVVTTVRRGIAVTVIGLLIAAAQVVLAPAASAQAYVPITGSGSTWSLNAIEQWIRNVGQLGIQVRYRGNGSSAGRNDFRAGVVDFAVSEAEYGITDGGVTDALPTRGFAYVPLVAGGTAFTYNLRIGGTRVTNLRLSGDTLARIFTRQITDWSDPAIAADNPGLSLPRLPIVPIVRSDGSGTTLQLTRWLAARHTAVWDAYCGRVDCGGTSNYPVQIGIEAKSGSVGVTAAVAADSAVGAITYVENSYVRNAGLPSLKVLNDAGFYVEPAAGNVAVALTRAEIRDDLTADLDAVYGGEGTDPRSYPLSNYSYLIVPTDLQANFTTEKGRSLSEFLYYSLCEGQQLAEGLGYSPLPLNLVRAGVRQAARIPGTTNKLSDTNLVGCNNPTFDPNDPDRNVLAETTPQPPECDRAGATQCGTGGSVTPAPTATPSPSPSVAPSPSPSATPSASPSPRPTLSPTPSTPPRGQALADRIRRALATALARAYGVPDHADLPPRAQLRQVLRDIIRAAAARPRPALTSTPTRGNRLHE